MERAAKGSGSLGKYIVDNKGITQPLGLTCEICGFTSPIKSNLGVAEELGRVRAYLEPPRAPSCPDETCPNHGRPVGSETGLYHKFGFSKAKNQVYRCVACRKNFVDADKSRRRHRRGDVDARVFLDLVNGGAVRRIAETNRIGLQTIYDKLDFIWEQCRTFAGAAENQLTSLKIPRLWVSTDRQDYLVNWTSREKRAASQLGAVATADNRTSYVFAIHLDFDPTLKQEEVEADAAARGDLAQRQERRRYARLWLRQDYLDATKGRRFGRQSKASNLSSEIADDYSATLQRPDVETPPVEPGRRLSDYGVQVRADYAMYGHFQHLARLFENVGKVRFFMDLDSALRGACLSAFAEPVKDGRCDAFYVRIAKGVRRDEKEKRVGQAWAEFDQKLGILAGRIAAGEHLETIDPAELFAEWGTEPREPTDEEILAALVLRKGRTKERRRSRNPAAANRPSAAKSMLPPRDKRVEDYVLRMMIRERLPNLIAAGPWNDKFLEHPLPTMAEPRKMVAWLTERDEMSEDHAANLYAKASLHGIDRFFMVLRRRLNMAERSLNTATKVGAMFHLYHPYNPGNLAKLIEILRVYYNFVVPGEDKRTPAMRLGLVSRPLSVEDILAFPASAKADVKIVPGQSNASSIP